MKIGCMIGSLREDSYNRKVYTALVELAPEGVDFSEINITGLPVFNADEEDPLPEEVVALKKDIEAVDAIVFVSPEYNRSIPGGLKNAIDWATRGEGNSFNEKVGAVIGATPGRLNTVSMQMHLKAVMVYLGMHVVGQPEVYIGSVDALFDEAGTLTDEKVRSLLEELINAVKAVV